MKGFMGRDLYFLAQNVRFYLVFIAAMVILSVFSDFNSSWLFFYIMIFCASALVGLFSYDEVNHWQAYAATVSNGRKAQVSARYAVALLVCLLGTICLLALACLSRLEGAWTMAVLYGAMVLAYVDLVFPLSYYFGAKSRLVVIIILAVGAGGIGIGSSMMVISGGGPSSTAFFTPVAIPLVLLGLAGMGISHRISVAIMTRKEL